MRIKLTPVSGFTSKAIAEGLKPILMQVAQCFLIAWLVSRRWPRGYQHQAILVGGRKPKNVSEFLWVSTTLGNLKISLGGVYHAFGFAKYASRYLAAFAYRFNRHLQIDTLPKLLLVAAIAIGPRSDAWLRSAEAVC